MLLAAGADQDGGPPPGTCSGSPPTDGPSNTPRVRGEAARPPGSRFQAVLKRQGLPNSEEGQRGPLPQLPWAPASGVGGGWLLEAGTWPWHPPKTLKVSPGQVPVRQSQDPCASLLWHGGQHGVKSWASGWVQVRVGKGLPALEVCCAQAGLTWGN